MSTIIFIIDAKLIKRYGAAVIVMAFDEAKLALVADGVKIMVSVPSDKALSSIPLMS